ncbi:Chemotaxis protein CheY [Stieleria maiorica]|uniref:Chemotaxis protein CheY n=1 Tax=Stieleria maiorica TaxID=2795974 RepID=A0A5B9MBX2_9BACT|nr:response regulator [Stieleria maiorica]QEF98263.1 Chemotaxis protein CheY [Stieleria maiorica]
MNTIPKRRVLIADDEPGMRTTLADILTDNGYDVRTAENGKDAITKCLSEDYDVVLMDVRMPVVDGISAFREIRRSSQHVRVILMSAYGEEDLKHTALQDGAIAFLDKPLNLDTVIQLVADSTELSVMAITGDDSLVSILPQCLKSSAQKLTVVRNSDEAGALLGQVSFDVALIDVELGATDGLACYLALREISPTITAVMVSRSDAQIRQIAEEAVRRTAYTIVPKPIEPERLAEVMQTLRAQRVSGAIRKPDLGEPHDS